MAGAGVEPAEPEPEAGSAQAAGQGEAARPAAGEVAGAAAWSRRRRVAVRPGEEWADEQEPGEAAVPAKAAMVPAQVGCRRSTGSPRSGLP